MHPISKRALAGVAAVTASAASLIGLDTPPVSAQESTPGIVDIVLDVSGPQGFDDDPSDYDLLRDALVATGLVDAVASAVDVTVFAPTDRAFIRLARDLGYDGRDEAGSFAYLAELTGFVSADDPGLLDDVLLYHVSPGAKTVRELRRTHPVSTLLEGATVEVVGSRVVDADRNDRDARIVRPRNLEAANGVIQTVNRVLRPLDLEAPTAPLPSIVDIVLGVSGDEGFDQNASDYDLLRDALVATGLVGAVAAAEDVTVFAPTDRAFIRLARDLGFEGHDEAGAFGFLAAATGFVSADEPGLLDDVLLYHVSPAGKTVSELRATHPVPTLLEGATVAVVGNRVIDADRDDRDARIVRPRNLEASNGVVQTVNRVLRPIDL